MARKEAERKQQQQQKKKSKMKNTNNKEEKEISDNKKNNTRTIENNEDIITDTRFASVHWDPRFKRAPKNHSKVSLDSRFNKILTDKNFSSSSAPLDKRGKRRKPKPQSHLLHYYHQEPEPEPEEEQARMKSDDDGRGKIEGGGVSESDSSESEHEDEDDQAESEATTSTSDDDDESDEVYSEEDVPLEKEDIPVIERETHRLAVVNMDWHYIKAVDLYVAFGSDLPKGGQILSVAVYPTEFGLKRMEEESVRGPTALFDSDKEHSEDDDDEDDEIDDEKLRAYEMSKLSYYYAVVECDSSATADYLYQTFNEVEFERTSNKFDLRFIPDSMEFKHPPRDVATEAPANYQPVDFSTRALQHTKIHLSWDDDEPNRKKIMKRKFKPDQLDELELKEFLASDDGESDDDDENDDAEASLKNSSQKPNKRDIYRALLQSGDGSDANDDGDKDMEVTFNTGLEDISKRFLEKQDKKSETVWEAYLRKRSEKRKERKRTSKLSSSDDDDSDYDQKAAAQPDDFFLEESLDTDVEDPKKSSKDNSKKTKSKKRKTERRYSPEDTEKEQVASKEELELLLTDDKGTEPSLKGYNLKSKNVKGKRGKEVLTEDKLPTFDHDDPRFAPILKSHLFALDPTDPQFKRSATYLRQLAQKQQKSRGNDTKEKDEREPSREEQLLSEDRSSKKQKHSQSNDLPSEKDKHELSSLVRSVKRKVGTLHR
ncbi:hypothetical protein MRB53_014374 [Persea americana]|uniref:Uncharacterized protein n=1 Tax=Persea americana TaxID=3435 RepID=A0ACC2KAM6_PERAE|nr:hypothetical protein MRB53_014374 [Persea americana]